MDFLAPPMYDVSNINMWKFKMSAYLKALGLHVFIATTNKSYVDNGKHIEANTQALEALRHTLGKEHLSLISHCDSAFAMWNTLISLKKQVQYILEREPRRNESEQTCYIV